SHSITSAGHFFSSARAGDVTTVEQQSRAEHMSPFASAQFSYFPVRVAFACTWIEADAPAFRVPSDQLRAGPPPDEAGLLDTYAMPSGMLSVTTTLFASACDGLVTVML